MPSLFLRFRLGPIEWALSVFAPETDDSRRLLERLEHDFSAFDRVSFSPGCSADPVREELALHLADAPSQPGWSRLRPAFRFRDSRCFGWGSARRVVYPDGAEARVRHRGSRAELYARSPERLHELAYLYVLSKTGEHLDRQGLHRVHALGVISPRAGGAVLLPMDSGTGKSTLALALMREERSLPSGLALLSEEIPLLGRGGRVHAFPLRAALSEEALRNQGMDPTRHAIFARLGYPPKRLVDLKEMGAVAREAAPLRHIVVCTRSAGSRLPVFVRAGRLEVLGFLFRVMVVGQGVPQMAEHLLRFDPLQLLFLARVALSRSLAAVRAVREARVWRLSLGPDPAANLAVLRGAGIL